MVVAFFVVLFIVSPRADASREALEVF